MSSFPGGADPPRTTLDMPGLRCGASRAQITPTLGLGIPGGSAERLSTGVRDELFVRCLCLESGSVEVAVAVVDAVDLPRSLVERVRADVQRRIGLPAANIVISSTHAHTAGPTVETSFVRAVDEDYLRWLARRIADALLAAHRRRVPARIGFGLGQVPGVAFNRRFHMRDGRVRTNPGVGNPDVVEVAGPSDPQVGVVRIDDADGRPLATITNFACHADTVGGTLYSGDFPGVLDQTVAGILGPDVVGLFAQGASGNINHVDVGDPQSRGRPHTQRIGRALGAETVKVRELTDARAVEIGVASRLVPLSYRRLSAAQLAEARAALAPGSTAPTALKKLAPQMLELATRDDPDPVAEITAIRCGPDAAMVFLPGELFVEFGLRIKAESPFRFTIVNELSNASVGGYICTRPAYEEGGYEPMPRRYSRLGEEAGDRLADSAVDVLHELQTNA